MLLKYIIFTAVPIYLKLTSAVSDSMVPEETVVSLVCTGNIGRPLGYLILSRSYSSSPHDFYPIETLKLSNQDGVTMLYNGTYRVKQTFYTLLSRHENGSNFQCQTAQNSYSPPYMKDVSSEPVKFFINCK